MLAALDPIDRRLLGNWQRDLPLLPRPFAEVGRAEGVPEAEVLDRLRCLARAGAISRVGATARPNTAGASTLAAIAAPEARVEEVAAAVGAEPGVNHSYLRENRWNVWFVATGPDRGAVDAALDRIRASTELGVLDLPLVRAFNVDLGFPLDGTARRRSTRAEADASAILPGDRPVIQAMSGGLELVPRPFAALAAPLGRTEGEVIDRVRALSAAAILSRIGVIVRHRALGWTSNAMVVWDVPVEEIDAVGPVLAEVPGVTLCYRRRIVPGVWPYPLYCMIHGRSRSEALAVLDRARRQIPPLSRAPHQVLFSLRCFRQRGALIDQRESAA